MNLGTIRSALQRRGLNDASPTDLNQAINDACVELDSLVPWPYLEKTATGTAPLTVSDLGQVDTVADTTNKVVLARASQSELLAIYGDLTIIGAPNWWFYTDVLGTQKVNVFPANTSVSLSVNYWKVSTTLSLDADTPLAPAAWHTLICDIAASYLYPDNATPPGLSSQIQRRSQAMMTALLSDYGASVVLPVGDDC